MVNNSVSEARVSWQNEEGTSWRASVEPKSSVIGTVLFVSIVSSPSLNLKDLLSHWASMVLYIFSINIAKRIRC